MKSAAVLLLAAVVYRAALGAGGVTFDVTAMFFGLAAVGAGLAARSLSAGEALILPRLAAASRAGDRG